MTGALRISLKVSGRSARSAMKAESSPPPEWAKASMALFRMARARWAAWVVPSHLARGARVAVAISTASRSSTGSPTMAEKSGSGRKFSARPSGRPGVQMTTSVVSNRRRARASSFGAQPRGGAGQASPRRARSLLVSSTMEEMPRRAASSISRRSSTVLPDPEPANTATCWRRRATGSSTGAPPSSGRP